MLAAGLFKENKGNHNNRRRNKKKKSKNNKNSDSEHKAIILLSFILNVPTAASPQLSGSIQEILIEGNDNELRQARICDSQAEISQVKWSPSNEVGQSKYLAAASHDGKLYCYKAPEISMDADSFIKNNNDHNNMKVYQDFVEIFEKKYSTPYFTFNFGNAVLHLDFTHDGYYLQATSRDENLLFVHTGDAIDDTNAKPGKQAFAKGLKNYNNAILKEDGENTFWEHGHYR
jgi:WD40 repeat protein